MSGQAPAPVHPCGKRTFRRRKRQFRLFRRSQLLVRGSAGHRRAGARTRQAEGIGYRQPACPGRVGRQHGSHIESRTDPANRTRSLRRPRTRRAGFPDVRTGKAGHAGSALPHQCLGMERRIQPVPRMERPGHLSRSGTGRMGHLHGLRAAVPRSRGHRQL